MTTNQKLKILAVAVIGSFLGAVLILPDIVPKPEFSPPEPVAEVSPIEAPALKVFHLPSSEVGASISSAPAFIFMDVSAYCICSKCCSKKWADGFTASGVPAVGRICAAPPEYPFGTVLDVEGYGEYVVQDRGGAIKGNKLDLLFSSHPLAKGFGRQYLKVRVVE